MRTEREIASCDVKEGPGGGEGDGPSISSYSIEERKSGTDNRIARTSPRPNEDIKLVYENSSVAAPHNHPRPSVLPSLPPRSTITISILLEHTSPVAPTHQHSAHHG